MKHIPKPIPKTPMELTNDLWPMDVVGPYVLKISVDEHLRRAEERASKMPRDVKEKLQSNPGVRSLIILFKGVEDELVNFALTLDHMEQVVYSLEQRKIEGRVVCTLIQKLQTLRSLSVSG